MSRAATLLPFPRKITQEAANQLTHALGLTLSVVGVPLLVAAAFSRGTLWEQVGCTVYGTTLIALYAASTLSHSFQEERWRQFFRMLDQVCIFLLFAGTFTPFALAYFREGWLWIFSIVLWVLTIVAVVYKLFVLRHRNMATWVYVVLGWSPVIALKPLALHVDGDGLAWILAGGLSYTVGTVFLLFDDKVPYFHAVWHVFVMAGSACHFFAVMFFLLPPG